MKCCRRSTFGLYVGCFDILFNTVGIIFYWVADKEFVGRLIFSIIYILLVLNSSFFIAGIVKKRYKFMRPWLLLYGLSLTAIFCYFLYRITLNVHVLMHTLVLFGIEFFCLMLWRIYNLYRDIRIHNKENTCQGQRIATECTVELIV
ncbi:uncharacterized protein LOC124421124 [Lucilia cuprina]|uniref:uncharacterized protein LOC124421124 n=1 Tax=Lucilia cuprina TaxID=7375 RepID=UPI001F06D615|nr:uncharacterized protein LOC124421124 [Lucilia cuprina]